MNENNCRKCIVTIVINHTINTKYIRLNTEYIERRGKNELTVRCDRRLVNNNFLDFFFYKRLDRLSHWNRLGFCQWNMNTKLSHYQLPKCTTLSFDTNTNVFKKFCGYGLAHDRFYVIRKGKMKEEKKNRNKNLNFRFNISLSKLNFKGWLAQNKLALSDFPRDYSEFKFFFE